MRDTGGSAFPRVDTEVENGSEGMTLRDYYIGQAMSGLLAITNLRDHDAEVIAKHAINQADAMIKERNK